MPKRVCCQFLRGCLCSRITFVCFGSLSVCSREGNSACAGALLSCSCNFEFILGAAGGGWWWWLFLREVHQARDLAFDNCGRLQWRRIDSLAAAWQGQGRSFSDSCSCQLACVTKQGVLHLARGLGVLNGALSAGRHLTLQGCVVQETEREREP